MRFCQSHPPPPDWRAWYWDDGRLLGWMPPERATMLAQLLPRHLPLRQEGAGRWVWHAASTSVAERSQVLQTIANDLYARGLIHGWRNERYACWGNCDAAWPYPQPELFRLERSAFRYFGLRSHAVHVHGITVDGRMWCGRRAANKAIDPKLLDNLAAGGLPADEQPVHCAVREIQEEAGLHRTPKDFIGGVYEILSERAEPEGWHNERLFVYTTRLAAHERPINRDGEVSEFMCLDLPEVLRRIQAGEFTLDAALCITTSYARYAHH